MTIFNDFLETFFNPNAVILVLVVFLIIMTVIVISLIKNNRIEDEEEQKEPFDLKILTEKLENRDVDDRIILTSKYEEEQEQKAIISYDELLKNASSMEINCEEEQNLADELTVKKIDTEKTNKSKTLNEEVSTIKSFYNYDKEEEFLKTLKEFRANLS